MPGRGRQARRLWNTSMQWVQGQRDAWCTATAQRGDPDPTSTERGRRQRRLPRGGELCLFWRSFQDKVKVKVSLVSNSLRPHGMLEWVAIPFCRGSSWPRDWIRVSRIAGRLLTAWTTRGAPFQDKEKLTGENIPGQRQQRPRMVGENKQIKQLNQTKTRSLLLQGGSKRDMLRLAREAGRTWKAWPLGQGAWSLSRRWRATEVL